jgi:CBS domain-containing protein
MRAPVIAVPESTPLETAAQRMTAEGVHALVVVSGPAEEPSGIVTSTDLLRALAGAAASPQNVEDLPIDEVMTVDPVSASPDASVADAARLLAETGARHLPVVDGTNKLVGILSERDLIEHLRADIMSWPDATTERLDEPVGAVMTPNPTVLYSGTRLRDAYAPFADERLSAIPVVDDDGRLLGILSYVDVLAWLRDRARPPEAPAAAGAWTIEPP